MTRAVDRAALEEARARVRQKQRQEEALRAELESLGDAAGSSPRSVFASAGAIGLVTLCAALLGLLWHPAPAELPEELRARLQTLRSDVVSKHRARTDYDLTRKGERRSPERHPRLPHDAYPTLRALKAASDDPDERALAWAQIGIAACTVRDRELARLAGRNLRDLDAVDAIIAVDRHCMQQGLYL